MTRGDAHKIVEWIEYHSVIGFRDFQIVLDGDVDGTESVLESISGSHAITIHRRREVGEYYDGLSVEERADRISEWRSRNESDLQSGVMRGIDPLSWRQHRHLAPIMEQYKNGSRGRGWLALFDVDEYLVIPRADTIQTLAKRFDVPRLRFLSFDVDTTGYDQNRPVLQQHSRRWSREDLIAEGGAYSKRVKSMVRYRKARLEATIHKISWGRSATLDWRLARIHHFRMPNQPGIRVPYSVEDWIKR